MVNQKDDTIPIQSNSNRAEALLGNPINLSKESLYLQGARDMLMKLIDICKIDFGWYNLGESKHKEEKGSRSIYNKCISDFLLSDRENVRRFLQGDRILCYDHQRNKKGKFISVKVKYEDDKGRKVLKEEYTNIDEVEPIVIKVNYAKENHHDHITCVPGNTQQTR